MKRILLILITTVFALNLQAQTIENTPAPNEEKIYTSDIDVMPEFNGGMHKFYARIKRIPYTFFDRMNERKGRVIVLMVVEKDGSLSNLKVLHGLSELQDKEIIRVIKRLRPWKPGMHKGKPVRVLYSVPINFELADKLTPA
jgi:protein TonB